MAHRHSRRSDKSAQPERTEESVRPVTPAPTILPFRISETRPLPPLGPPPAYPPPPPPVQPGTSRRPATYSLFPRIEPPPFIQRGPLSRSTTPTGPSQQLSGGEGSDPSPSSSQLTWSPPSESLSPQRGTRPTPGQGQSPLPERPPRPERPARPDEPARYMPSTSPTPSTERPIARRPPRPEDNSARIVVPNFSRQIPEITPNMLKGIVKEQNRSLRHCHKSITDLKQQNLALSLSDQDFRSKYQKLQQDAKSTEDAYDELYEATKAQITALLEYGDLQRDVIRIVVRNAAAREVLKNDQEWKHAVERLDEFCERNWRVMERLYPDREVETTEGDRERAFFVHGVWPGS